MIKQSVRYARISYWHASACLCKAAFCNYQLNCNVLNIFQIINIEFHKQLLGGYQIDSRLNSDGVARRIQQHATVAIG